MAYDPSYMLLDSICCDIVEDYCVHIQKILVSSFAFFMMSFLILVSGNTGIIKWLGMFQTYISWRVLRRIDIIF